MINLKRENEAKKKITKKSIAKNDPLTILKFTLSRWVISITRHPPGKKHNSLMCESFLPSTYRVASFFFSPKFQRKKGLFQYLQVDIKGLICL